MADDVLTEHEDDEELVVVEVDEAGKRIAAEGDEEPKPKPDEGDDEGDDEDEGDLEDARLAESQDDLDEDVTKKRNREKRAHRREMQKRAREHQEAELQRLSQTNAALVQRLEALEGHTVSREAQNVATAYQQAMREVQQAEVIIAKASTAGNGDDVVAAMRIRDDAMARAQGHQAQYEAFTRAAPQQQERQAQPGQDRQVDPRVKNYGQEWMRANPWYSPNGTDEDSLIVDAIDRAMTAQGKDPTSRGYWEELTRKVAARVGTGEGADDGDDNAGHVNQRDTGQQGRRRAAPPTGNTRGDATVRSRREVVVTPERKAAMQEAGVWDDPVARTRYLKSYQAYDKQHPAR